MALKYKEKLAKSKEYFAQVKENVNRDEIENKLSEEGYSKFDIRKIRSGADSYLEEEYGEKIRQYLLDQTLEDHLHEFDLVDQEWFEKIQKKEYNKIRAQISSQVNKLHDEGKSPEEIESIINSPYYNVTDVENQIEKYIYHNKPTKHKSLYRFGGILAIIIGIVLTVASQERDGSVRIFYGLIIVGIIMLFKSNLSQAEIEGK